MQGIYIVYKNKKYIKCIIWCTSNSKQSISAATLLKHHSPAPPKTAHLTISA